MVPTSEPFKERKGQYLGPMKLRLDTYTDMIKNSSRSLMQQTGHQQALKP